LAKIASTVDVTEIAVILRGFAEEQNVLTLAAVGTSIAFGKAHFELAAGIFAAADAEVALRIGKNRRRSRARKPPIVHTNDEICNEICGFIDLVCAGRD
jgi:hypothetical protein